MEQTHSSISPNYDIVIFNQELTYDVPSVPQPTFTDYDIIKINEPTQDNYDVIKTVESQPVVHSSTAVREEVTDQFHNAEQHVYAAVNKKEKRKTEDKNSDMASDEEIEQDE